MCDTVVMVKRNRVLFAKNSDRDPNEAQLIEWHAAAEHKPDERLRCTWIEIPQVAHTHAVLLSRPFWIWGAEMGANQHGVAIGNEAVFTKVPVAKVGLTGMDLVRLGLERGATAIEAAACIVDLIETHGQGGGCGHENQRFTYHNSFLVADPRKAIVLETAGRHWKVETVTHGVRSISNGLTIADFAARFADPLISRVAACNVRQARTQKLAAAAEGPGDLMRVLSDHGEGHRVPRYRLLNGGMSAPCMHAGGLVAASQTTASWVSELKPEMARHWVTATAAPCCSLFKPVYVEQPLELGHSPTVRADADSLWWRGERLHRAVMRNPAELWPLFADERDALQQQWLAAPPDPEKAFAEANDRLARWIERVQSRAVRDVRPAYVRRYWNKRNRRCGIDLLHRANRPQPVAG